MQKWRKAGMLLLGLIAPEVVAWIAFLQRQQAKKLTRKMQAMYREQHGINEPPRTHWSQKFVCCWNSICERCTRLWYRTKVFLLIQAESLALPSTGQAAVQGDKDAFEAYWTNLQSWYVVMGGVVLDVSSAEKPFLSKRRERLVLTPDGMVMLARHKPEVIRHISPADIKDKSKSDGLAKLITCWQAIWFCIQCICRLADGLSISLLELNVFAHAICALIIYALWWSKPKDISEPTKIVGNDINAIEAWMCNLSFCGRPTLFKKDWHRDRSSRFSFIPCQHHGQNQPHLCRTYAPDKTGTAYYSMPDICSPN